MGDFKLITQRNPQGQGQGLNTAPGQDIRGTVPGQQNDKNKVEPNEFFGEETNDIQLGALNDFVIIAGLDKLKQDINKSLLTELGQNANFDLYGSELQSLIGSKFSAEFVKAKIEEEIVRSLETLNFLNRGNENPDEIPLEIDSLTINPIANDTGFEVILTILTESGKLVTTSVVITS